MKTAFLSAAIMSISMLQAAAQDYLALPYYAEGRIRFYEASSATLHHTLNLTDDATTALGHFKGPNAVLMHKNLLFISFDVESGNGGVLIYAYDDVYPERTAAAPKYIASAKVAGMAIHPETEDLYIAQFYNGATSGRITRYAATSGYAQSSATHLPVPGNWINYYTGIAFDEDNNLWTGDLQGHRIICYTSLSAYNGFYVIGNGAATYPSSSRSGGSTNLYLFSAPEGLGFDPGGNLFISNNNDWEKTNGNGEGSFVKIAKAYVKDYLQSQPLSGTHGSNDPLVTYNVPAANASVYLIQGSKFGGLALSGHNLYLNDQGTNQGSNWQSSGTIWKWDTQTTFNSGNCVATGIHTTYPGMGGLSFNNPEFPLAHSSSSVADLNRSGQVRIYPNPAVGTVHVMSETGEHFSGFELRDIQGRVIDFKALQKNETAAFEMGEKSTGMYFINGISNNSRVFIGSFIKQ